METVFIESTDNKLAPTLKSVQPVREIFDPSNREHQIAYLVFMRTGRWIKKFQAEYPCVTVPATIEHKLLEHFLGHLEDAAMVHLNQPPAKRLA